jgi:hypothetical protein
VVSPSSLGDCWIHRTPHLSGEIAGVRRKIDRYMDLKD